jgi:Asp-tRNA(Asn)/Glu-tRNA(Gln) amidotransferase B subunit
MGYQITQFEIPTNGEGYVEFWINDYMQTRKIRIERAHIENDA